jgi:hypothetical protein
VPPAGLALDATRLARCPLSEVHAVRHRARSEDRAGLAMSIVLDAHRRADAARRKAQELTPPLQREGADAFRLVMLEDGTDPTLLPFLEAVVLEFMPDFSEPFAARIAGHTLEYLASGLLLYDQQIGLRTRRSEGVMPFEPPATTAERRDLRESPCRLAADEPFLTPIRKHMALLAEPYRTAVALLVNRALGIRHGPGAAQT